MEGNQKEERRLFKNHGHLATYDWAFVFLKVFPSFTDCQCTFFYSGWDFLSYAAWRWIAEPWAMHISKLDIANLTSRVDTRVYLPQQYMRAEGSFSEDGYVFICWRDSNDQRGRQRTITSTQSSPVSTRGDMGL